MVRRCGHLGSDLDLNLAARDWSEQVERRRIWAEPRHRQRFLEAIAQVVVPLGLLVDVAPLWPPLAATEGQTDGADDRVHWLYRGRSGVSLFSPENGVQE
jgi:hypothetical protein